jgi:hypothetical protein
MAMAVLTDVDGDFSNKDFDETRLDERVLYMCYIYYALTNLFVYDFPRYLQVTENSISDWHKIHLSICYIVHYLLHIK